MLLRMSGGWRLKGGGGLDGEEEEEGQEMGWHGEWMQKISSDTLNSRPVWRGRRCAARRCSGPRCSREILISCRC